jgi:opacity protein-like surface antigen
MKRTLLAGVAVLAACGAAGTVFAADLPARAPVFAPPPPIAPMFSWTGFYIGPHLGWGSAHKDWEQTFPTTGNSVGNGTTFNADGIIGGGQIGYNFQTGPWVWGIEADFTGSGMDGSGIQRNTATWTDTTDINWFGSVTGRLGYAWDRTMVYFKGGFAWADETHREFFSGGRRRFDPGRHHRPYAHRLDRRRRHRDGAVGCLDRQGRVQLLQPWQRQYRVRQRTAGSGRAPGPVQHRPALPPGEVRAELSLGWPAVLANA